MVTLSQSMKSSKKSECIQEFNSDPDKVRLIVENIRKRAELCIPQDGGHSEHLLLFSELCNQMSHYYLSIAIINPRLLFSVAE